MWEILWLNLCQEHRVECYKFSGPYIEDRGILVPRDDSRFSLESIRIYT